MSTAVCRVLTRLRERDGIVPVMPKTMAFVERTIYLRYIFTFSSLRLINLPYDFMCIRLDAFPMTLYDALIRPSLCVPGFVIVPVLLAALLVMPARSRNMAFHFFFDSRPLAGADKIRVQEPYNRERTQFGGEDLYIKSER